MVKGTISFRAEIRGNGIMFQQFAFKPNESGIDVIEMECPDGNEISCTVHFASVASSEQARAIGARQCSAALNRLAVIHSVAIGPTQIAEVQLAPLTPTPGVLSVECGEVVITSDASKCCIGIPALRLRADLEQSSHRGESYFGLYRSARQSSAPVEEFLHLYHVLLMLFEGLQTQVDDFIRRELPSVPQTQDPRPGKQTMETVFTRLRNELAHKRVGVNVEDTKSEMARWVDSLATLTAQAIRSQP